MRPEPEDRQFTFLIAVVLTITLSLFFPMVATRAAGLAGAGGLGNNETNLKGPASADPVRDKLRSLAALPVVHFELSLQSGQALNPELTLGKAELERRISALKKAVEQHPEDAAAFLQLGTYLSAAARSDEAENAFAQSARLFRSQAEARPQDGSLQAQLARALSLNAQDAEAERVVRATLRLVTNDWHCCAELGRLLDSKALQLLNGVTNRAADSSAAEGTGGILRQRPTPAQLAQARQCAAEADQCFERAVALAPGEAGALLERARHRAWEGALCAYAVRFLDENPAGQAFTEAQALLLLGTEESCARWSELAHLWRTNPAAVGFWAWNEALPAIGDSRGQQPLDALPESRRQHVLEATRMLEQLAQDPSPPEAAVACEILGVVRLMVTQAPAEARALFRRAVTLEPSRTAAWDGLFMAALGTREPREVVSVSEERLKFDDTVRNRVIAAKACERANLPEQALQHARAAVALDTNAPLGHLFLGALLLSHAHDSGTEAEAKQHFVTASALLETVKDRAVREQLAMNYGINAALVLALEGRPDAAREKLRQLAAMDTAAEEDKAAIRGIEAALSPEAAAKLKIARNVTPSARIWMEAEINGQLTGLIFDSGASIPLTLFRPAAERLGLKYSFPPANEAAKTGGLLIGHTEECVVSLFGRTLRAKLPVLEVAPDTSAGAEGLWGWPFARERVLQIDGSSLQAAPLDRLPPETTNWLRLRVTTNLDILVLELPDANGSKALLEIDTGDMDGVSLCPGDWRAWVAAHTNRPMTLSTHVSYGQAAGVLREAWAPELALGPLTLKDVPIRQSATNDTRFRAVLGIAALRRLDVIIDGPHGIAYLHPKTTPPPPYEHNRLGAFFLREGSRTNALVAEVLPGSPAQKAGVRDGDELVTINLLDPTNSLTDLDLEALYCPAGTRLELVLRRGAETIKVTPVLEDLLLPEGGVSALAPSSQPHRFGVYSDEGKAARLGRQCALLCFAGHGKLTAPAELEGTVMVAAILSRSLGITNEPSDFRNVLQDPDRFQDECLLVFPRVLERETNAKVRDAYLFSFCCMSSRLWAAFSYMLRDPDLEARFQRWLIASLARAEVLAEPYGASAASQCGKLLESAALPLNTRDRALGLASGIGEFQRAVLLKFIAPDEIEAVIEADFEPTRTSGNPAGSVSGADPTFAKPPQLADLLTQATNGNASAQLVLARSYLAGDGVPKDVSEALKWFRKSAELGNVRAQFLLGGFYWNGENVPTNKVEALKWLRLAGEKGMGDAQASLALMYLTGDGVPEDAAEAAQWARKGAVQGQAQAQLVLAELYRAGEGVPKDLAEAVKWWRRAAEQDDAAAQARLGFAYLKGAGVATNRVEAAWWWRQAADQGDGTAQLGLAGLYFEGAGVPKDLVESYKWTSLAVARGQANAAELLPPLEKRMTPEQLAEARRLAAGFHPRKSAGRE